MSERTRGDEGSAALEFIAVGVIMLVPMVYLIIALGTIQEHALGVEAAARQAARAIALAPNASAASERSEQVLATVVEEYGMDAGELDVTLTCRPAGDGCPSAGATLTITVTTRVALPLIPSVLGVANAASVTVEGTATQKVSRLWGAG